MRSLLLVRQLRPTHSLPLVQRLQPMRSLLLVPRLRPKRNLLLVPRLRPMYNLLLVRRPRPMRSPLLIRRPQFTRSLRKQPIPPEDKEQAREGVRSWMQFAESRASSSKCALVQRSGCCADRYFSNASRLDRAERKTASSSARNIER